MFGLWVRSVNWFLAVNQSFVNHLPSLFYCRSVGGLSIFSGIKLLPPGGGFSGHSMMDQRVLLS